MTYFLKKWAKHGLFLFIFKHKSTVKTLGFSGIRIQIVRVEGKPADHLTTTTAHFMTQYFIITFYLPFLMGTEKFWLAANLKATSIVFTLSKYVI